MSKQDCQPAIIGTISDDVKITRGVVALALALQNAKISFTDVKFDIENHPTDFGRRSSILVHNTVSNLTMDNCTFNVEDVPFEVENGFNGKLVLSNCTF